MDGIKGLKDVWKATSITAISYALTQYLTVTYIGPELPNITSSIVSLLALAFILKEQARQQLKASACHQNKF